MCYYLLKLFKLFVKVNVLKIIIIRGFQKNNYYLWFPKHWDYDYSEKLEIFII